VGFNVSYSADHSKKKGLFAKFDVSGMSLMFNLSDLSDLFERKGWVKSDTSVVSNASSFQGGPLVKILKTCDQLLLETCGDLTT